MKYYVMGLGLYEAGAEPLGMDDIIFYEKKMSKLLRIKQLGLIDAEDA
jgi:hypothetical protein